MTENTRFYAYDDPLGRENTLIYEDNKLTMLRTSAFRAPHLFNDKSLNLAILGDVHGHLTLALKRLEEWKDVSKHSIDAILQVGDIGALGYESNIDKTTKEMSEKDPDELGFRNYFYGSEEADYFFGTKGIFRDIPLIYIDGNHDDIDFINSISSNNNAPKYENLTYLKSGNKIEISNNYKSATVLGIGWHNQERTISRLQGQSADILLTHPSFSSGTYLYNPDLANIHFKFHFYGHHQDPAAHSDLYKNSYGLNEIKPKRQKPGSIGMLYLQENKDKFIYLPEKSV